jgi:uncharacterized Zn finger protein
MYIINFENFIEAEIVARGKVYLQQNRIEYANNLGDNTFKALIKGEQDYDVFVDLQQGEIIDYSCNCPYTWGKMCKHTVAFLLHIRAANLHLISGSATTGTHIETVLTRISDKQLRQFVFQQLLNNRDFREDFFAAFGQL